MSDKNESVCPHCGHCRECGRGGHQQTAPAYPAPIWIAPWWWQQQTAPYQSPFTVGGGTGHVVHYGPTATIASQWHGTASATTGTITTSTTGEGVQWSYTTA